MADEETKRTLQTPLVYAISPIFPNDELTVKFSYNDNQSVKNRCVITEYGGDVIYDNTINVHGNEHTVDRSKLTKNFIGGKQYTAQIQVFDGYEQESLLSSPIQFWCISSASIKLLNAEGTEIQQETIFTVADVLVKLQYNCADAFETLRQFQFVLLDNTQTPIKTSSVQYGSNNTYTYQHLEDGKTYYFKAIGETIHGMKLETSMYKINVKYVKAPANIVFDIENRKKAGDILIHANIIDVLYKVDNPDNVRFTEDSTVILYNNNSVTYEDGLKLDGEWTIQIEAKSIPIGQTIFSIGDELSVSVEEIGGEVYGCLNGISPVQQYAKIDTDIEQITVDGTRAIITNDGLILSIMNNEYSEDKFIVFEIKRQSIYSGRANIKQNEELDKYGYIYGLYIYTR